MDEIHNDKQSLAASAKRFPIRYIFFNNRKDYLEFGNRIQPFTKGVFYLRTLVSGDKWVTGPIISSFFNDIDQDSLVYDFSEIIRFLDDKAFNSVLTGISSKEAIGNFRIYVPIFALKDRFLSVFWDSFYRKTEWAPVWAVSGDIEKIDIYQLNFPLDLNDLVNPAYFIVNNAQDWFKFLDHQTTNIISCSDTLSRLLKNLLPDNYFDYKIINNIKDFLRVVMNKDIEITYDSEDEEYWKNILNIFSSNQNIPNFEALISFVFNIKKLENCDIYTLLRLFLQEEKDFNRWLLKKYLTECNRSDITSTYLRTVFKNITKPTKLNFLRSLWLEAFNIDIDTKTWMERKAILNFIHHELKVEHSFIEKDLKDILISIPNQEYDQIKPKLTMITHFEKQLFIRKLIETGDDHKIISEMTEMYPDLYYYLNWDNLEIDEAPSWVVEYFKYYNLSKLKDEKLKNIDHILDEINANKETFCRWYYEFNRPNTNFGKFVWVDGLGIEWLPLLTHYLNFYGENHNIIVEQKSICRAKLPTITEFNKWDDHEKISDLDEFCHKIQSFNLPEVLIEEIEIVKNIAKKIIERVDDELFVSADHGLTFLVNKRYGVDKIYNFDNTHHEGRCVLDFKNDLDEDKYFTWNLEDHNDRKALVASKHFSLGNLPRREVHGGATPEEVLVPFLKLKRIKEKTRFMISPERLEIDIRKPIFRIYINPEPYTEVFLIFQDKQFLLKKDDGFYVELKNIKVGKYNCIIKIGTEKIGYEFSVKGGFTEVDLI